MIFKFYILILTFINCFACKIKMNNEKFSQLLHQFSDWVVEYYNNIEKLPVKSQVRPGDIFKMLENIDKRTPVEIEKIFEDFKQIILPGITHWQSPNFFAYFPANTSPPSILAELLTSAIAAQCMVWETSPAAAELEEFTLNLLRDYIGLPPDFNGVIQDTASTATLVALLVARERKSNFAINETGFDGKVYRVYCSEEAHSSIEKAVKIAGYGRHNLVKIPTDDKFSLRADLLESAIKSDINNGFIPTAVVSAFGTTGSTAIDPIADIAEIAKQYELFHHVDAALAGSAMILPEFRQLARGVELADSFVFNPHKWLLTNFDCSAHFIKDKNLLINTFSINPEYLKTTVDTQVNNYRDWGIQLGRRFRSLKLWFVLRYYGIEGLQSFIRNHINLAKYFAQEIISDGNFELLTDVLFNTVCFRFIPQNYHGNLNELNEKLLLKINSSGKIYITHTRLRDKYTLRFVVGQTNTQKRHVDAALELIKKIANSLI